MITFTIPMQIVIDNRALKRNISGTERYIAGLLSTIRSNFPSSNQKITLLSDTPSWPSRFTSPGSFPALFHRTHQAAMLHDVTEMLTYKKCVYTYHDSILCRHPEYFPSPVQFNRYLKYFEISLHAADRIIAISRYEKKELVNMFHVPSEKIDVVYHGIDHRRFRQLPDSLLIPFKHKRHLPDQYLFYLGTDYPHKNLINLVLAFQEVLKTDDGKGYFLVIAGNRHYFHGDHELNRLIKPLRERIILPGYLPDEEIPLFYNAAQLVVFPSLEEGFGFPVLEAFACGTPLVCSNTASLPEIAADAALLVDTRNYTKLAHAIIELIGDQQMQRNLTTLGKLRAAEFTWEQCGRETAEVYVKAITTNQPEKFNSSVVRQVFEEYHNARPLFHRCFSTSLSGTQSMKLLWIYLFKRGFRYTLKELQRRFTWFL